MRSFYNKKQVKDAIERKSTENVIPLGLHKFWGVGLPDKYGAALAETADKYPDDVLLAFYNAPGEHLSTNANPSYRWGYKDYSGTETHSIGMSHVLLPDWSELERFMDDFPSAGEPGIFDNVKPMIEQAHKENRYVAGMWWKLFHERFWSIRGMENLMFDYYDDMENLKILGNRLLSFYKEIVDKFSALGVDAIFTSDDLGHQKGPMMSPAVFEELYFPLYKEFISYVHGKNMHVFLHSCGDNTLLMPYLIEAGLDVFHPVQKGCMDFKDTAEKFGGKITFLAGMDVQHKLPDGTPEEVRKEVREMVEIFKQPGGGLLLAAGNGIMPDTPLENIDAMLDEMTKCGE